MSEEESVRDIKEVKIDITELVKFLNKNADKISKIYYFQDDKLSLLNEGNTTDLKGAVSGFNLVEVK